MTPEPETTTPPDATPWLEIGAAVLALAAIFAWVYARFAGSLYFAMDDYIETEAALAKPLWAMVGDFFSGRLSWSGYRPVAYSVRALLAHAFGVQNLTGYYFFGLGLHFLNTLLVFHLVWRVARWVIPAFVAALFFLLLPAHNEAVLYMSASANLMALLLALVSLEASLALPLAERNGKPLSAAAGRLLIGLAAVASLLAMLAYEVTLPLMILVLLADWGLTARTQSLSWQEFVRRRAPLYLALGLAAAIAMGLRMWAGGGALGPERSDYGVSFAPGHLLRGYTLLFSQIVLLFNSPWMHLPDYVYTREWMSLTNPRALASVVLAAGAVCAVFWLALRKGATQAGKPLTGRSTLYWIGWGALWALLMALPFAALAARNPENRYTYIPSFGVAVAAAALVAWLFVLVSRQSWRRGGQIALTLLVAGWMGVYGWITTSDVAEFGRAGAHARAVLAAVDGIALADTASIAAVGVPGDVGSAYVFTTREALAAALRLHGAPASAEILAGDLALRSLPLEMSLATEGTTLIGYDRTTFAGQQVEWALFCANAADPFACRFARFAAGSAPVAKDGAPWLYAQVYDVSQPQSAGVAMIVEASDTPRLRSCWQFVDATQTQVDPASFNTVTAAEACASAFAGLLPRIQMAAAEIRIVGMP